MKKTKILALVLAASLLAGCGGVSGGGVKEAFSSGLGGTGEYEAAPEEKRPDGVTFSDGVHADTDYADMAWYIYDTTEFHEKADELRRTWRGSRAIELYDWLMSEYTLVLTLNTLAYIDFYAHPDSDAISSACQQLDSILSETQDTMCSAVSAALEGTAEDALVNYLGEDRAEALRGYDAMTDRESEISERVSELRLQYNTLIAQDLSYSEQTERIGGIYRELVDLHNEEAETAGYDSYAAYAYELLYGRDFTPDDAAVLCDAVKPYARRYFENLYSSAAAFADFTVNTDVSERELVALLREHMPSVSAEAGEAAEYMAEHGLYFMDSIERVSDLGYTTTLAYYNAPFIYMGLIGDYYDIQSIFHEFGHYYDAYVNPDPDYLLSLGSLDIFEIHSTGMEALSTGWYEDIYGEEADLARVKFLDNALYTVFTGCMFDEFQRIVYADPDMTPAEMNETFVEVARSYGLRSYSRMFPYYWMQVSHNFESPFYYISYAVSMLAALQIYEMAEEDWAQAAEFYNDLVSLGAFDYTYCELLEKVGLECFTDGLPACVAQAVEDMDVLCLAYENAA